MDYYHNIVYILAGLIVVVFIGMQLFAKIKPYLTNGQWYIPVIQAIQFMAIAEDKFDNGADRKVWVMETLKEAMTKLNIECNYEAISNMIDAICRLSKILNKK